jgi:hypothetical protein
MAKRYNRISTLVNLKPSSNPGPWGLEIGHPCGFLATDRHLRTRPSLSKAVGDYLLSDASMSGDFEDMLMMMTVYKLKVSKRVKLHLKQWVKAGCPTWKNNIALGIALAALYTGKFGNSASTYYDVRDISNKLWTSAGC